MTVLRNTLFSYYYTVSRWLNSCFKLRIFCKETHAILGKAVHTPIEPGTSRGACLDDSEIDLHGDWDVARHVDHYHFELKSRPLQHP